VSVSLGRIGDLRRQAGDAAAALEIYEEALRIDRSLAARDPRNVDATIDLIAGLALIGQ
jgi:hypothetical protein